MDRNRHYHNRWFCTVCDKMYSTIRGITNHIIRVHGYEADSDPCAFRCDFRFCKRTDSEPNGRVMGSWRA